MTSQLNELHIKHPEVSPVYDDLLIPGPIVLANEVIFDSIDESEILRVSLGTKGAAGVLGLDAEGKRRILGSKIFGNAATNLKGSTTRLTRIMCTISNANPESLEASLFCRLIPLDKNSGMRPIGIGDAIQRIIGKL